MCPEAQEMFYNAYWVGKEIQLEDRQWHGPPKRCQCDQVKVVPNLGVRLRVFYKTEGGRHVTVWVSQSDYELVPNGTR